MFVIVQWHTIFILLVLPLGCFGDYIVIHPKLMKQEKLHCLLEKKKPISHWKEVSEQPEFLRIEIWLSYRYGTIIRSQGQTLCYIHVLSTFPYVWTVIRTTPTLHRTITFPYVWTVIRTTPTLHRTFTFPYVSTVIRTTPTLHRIMLESAPPVTTWSSSLFTVMDQILSSCSSIVDTQVLDLMTHSLTRPSDPLQKTSSLSLHVYSINQFIYELLPWNMLRQ